MRLERASASSASWEALSAHPRSGASTASHASELQTIATASAHRTALSRVPTPGHTTPPQLKSALSLYPCSASMFRRDRIGTSGPDAIRASRPRFRARLHRDRRRRPSWAQSRPNPSLQRPSPATPARNGEPMTPPTKSRLAGRMPGTTHLRKHRHVLMDGADSDESVILAWRASAEVILGAPRRLGTSGIRSVEAARKRDGGGGQGRRGSSAARRPPDHSLASLYALTLAGGPCVRQRLAGACRDPCLCPWGPKGPHTRGLWHDVHAEVAQLRVRRDEERHYPVAIPTSAVQHGADPEVVHDRLPKGGGGGGMAVQGQSADASSDTASGYLDFASSTRVKPDAPCHALA